MEPWIWHQFRMEHPPAWEMLMYSRRREQGRCAFADRGGYRLEFNWRRAASAPDFDSLLGEYRERLEGADGAGEITSLCHQAWRGWQVSREQGATSHVGRYFDDPGCLIEIVLIWREAPDEALARRVLDSVATESVCEGLEHWHCFGMDLRVDASLELDSCRVEPARVEMSFADPKDAQRVTTLARFGLIEHWLDGSVDQWLARRMTEAPTEQRVAAQADHEIAYVEAPAAATPRWRRKKRRHRAAAWICPRDGRLYRADVTDRDAEIVPGRHLDCGCLAKS
ncbi:MAG: hypothetical protein CMJ18_10570 [Phycisphaeraceae bacterium]|nr:hypothetical protein [Phycisphaeraceae bacterium]